MKIKKAEITTGMIVGVIIVVITFALIILVYSQINWSGDTDREVCKADAIARGTISEGKYSSLLQAKDIVPIRCKTKKICVTTNKLKKGECGSDFGTSEGKYSTYRISGSDKEKAEQQIKTLIAREMADCWDMLGRGKFAIFNREITVESKVGAVAIVCARIHFDDTITGDKKGQLGIKEISGLNNYLLTHKVPNNNMSYWDFLRNAYDGETFAILTSKEENTQNYFDFLNEKMDISQTKAITFMEIRPSLAGALIGGGAGIFTGAIVGIGGIGNVATNSMILGAAGFETGEFIQLQILKKNHGLFPDGTAAAGIIVTDYSFEGFKEKIPEIKKKEQSFEIASYA